MLASFGDFVEGFLNSGWEELDGFTLRDHVFDVLHRVVAKLSALGFPVVDNASEAFEVGWGWDLLVEVVRENLLDLSIDGNSGLQLLGQSQMVLGRSIFQDLGGQVVELHVSAGDD